MSPAEVRAAAAAAERRLARAWGAITTAMQLGLSAERLAALLAAGRIEDATEVIVRAARRFSAAWNGEFARAGQIDAGEIQAALRQVAQTEVVVDFDTTNDHAVRAMRENRVRLVREITEQQRRAIREAINSGVERGVNPRTMAREMRASIGLTAHQVRAVNNFRSMLERNDSEALTRQLRDRNFDPQIRRAISSGEPLTRKQIDTMVARYRQRFVNYRAETIARTEALRAVHEGSRSMFQQAIAEGQLGADEITREWNTAKDDRVRDSHTAMHGQLVVGVDTPFISGEGNALMYPGDPLAPPEDSIQCRCAVGTRMRLGASHGAILSAEVIS